jgi:hypothetical protein
MIIQNEDVKELRAGIPEGHKHMRTTILLDNGSEMTFQEATIANIVRAYIGIKTHPQATSVRFIGKKLEVRKDGYAEWQLIETDVIKP